MRKIRQDLYTESHLFTCAGRNVSSMHNFPLLNYLLLLLLFFRGGITVCLPFANQCKESINLLSDRSPITIEHVLKEISLPPFYSTPYLKDQGKII